MYYTTQRTINRINLRNSFFFAILLLFVLQVTACAQPKTLTILHTNDIHTSYLPHEAAWMKTEPKPMVGGLRELQFAIDSIRATTKNILLLDAGDDMTGNPISEIEYKKAFGGGLMEMMNTLGYDAWTPGNHDLDISQENLKQLIAIAKYPALNANIVDSAGNSCLNTKPYTIVEKNGIRIGIIGLMTDELFHVTNTNNLKGLKLLPAIEITQKIIDQIDDKTDLIIALTHKGVEEDSALAMGVHGLDLIIGGHSHTRLKSPKFINGVIIGQTGSNCENLGKIEIEVENDKVTKYNGELIQLWKHAELPENNLSKMITEFKSKIDAEYGIALATLEEDWKRSGSEATEIGFFVAEAIRIGGDADFGITNSSGIRKDLLKGTVTKLDLFEVAPFRNYVCTFSISGEELRTFIQRYVEDLAKKRSSLQIAGVECTFTTNGEAVTIQSISINGKEIDNSKTYTCATTDFLLNQGDKYLGFSPASSNCTTVTMFNAMVSKIQQDRELQPSGKHFQSN